MDVALIRWPEERARRTELAMRKMPRLLLLEPEAEPPLCPDPLEDWVRVPAAPCDVRARAENLVVRFDGRRSSRLGVDADGLMRFGKGHARLTPLQARLVKALVEKMGAVVSRTELTMAGWESSSGEASANALEANIVRLRRRLEPVGLRIRTVRSRGYLLEEADNTTSR